MKKDIKVHEVMSSNLLVLHPKDKVKRAKEIFENYEVHHILVAVMGEIKGIISLGDLLFLEGFVVNSFDQFLRSKKYALTTVDEIMTSKPICIQSNQLLTEALDLMLSNRVNALPVLEGEALKGIITSRDMMQYLKEKLEA